MIHGSKWCLVAAELGHADLDELAPCQYLTDIVRERASAQPPSEILLDLEFCWIEYSFVYLFLDEALRLLKMSTGDAPKKLNIVLSINLGEPQFMATLLFRLSKEIACDSAAQPIRLLEAIQSYCSANAVEITVVSRLKGDLNSTKESSFVLGHAEALR